MTEFNFARDDIVFIGHGSCVDAALASVAEADAIAVILTTQEEWYEGRLGLETPPRQNLIFDQGRVSKSRDLLGALARIAPGLRVFLVGNVPRETTFRPPPIVPVKHALDGASPRQLERRAFCSMCLSYGFVPEALHRVARPRQSADDGLFAKDPAHALEIQEQRIRFRDWVAQGRENGQRPRIDFVANSRDSAIVTESLPHSKTMLARRWAECPFDTAFMDQDLVRRYAITGVRWLLVEPEIVLLEHEELTASAAALGMRLHAFDAGLDEDGG